MITECTDHEKWFLRKMKSTIDAISCFKGSDSANYKYTFINRTINSINIALDNDVSEDIIFREINILQKASDELNIGYDFEKCLEMKPIIKNLKPNYIAFLRTQTINDIINC